MLALGRCGGLQAQMPLEMLPALTAAGDLRSGMILESMLWCRPFCLIVFWGGRNLYMSTNLAKDSYTSRQMSETSRIVGCTARPAPGEAACPW